MSKFLKAVVIAATIAPLAFAEDGDGELNRNVELVKSIDAAPLKKAVAELDVSVSCKVDYFVDASGATTDITADCTPPEASAAAQAAVEAMRYKPRLVDGIPVRSKKLSLPLEVLIEPAETKQLAVADRDAAPIKPPNSKILSEAVDKVRRSANCEVRMDVDVNGVPFNLEADCSVSRYESAAIRAVQEARFAPKIIDGVAHPRTGVVYPFDLRTSARQMKPDEKIPCIKERTSKKEIRLIEELIKAIELKDFEAADSVISKVKVDRLYCPHQSIYKLLMVRRATLSKEFDRASDLLEDLEVFLEQPRTSSPYIQSLKPLYKQWIEFNQALQNGEVKNDSEMQLLIPICHGNIWDAYKTYKKEDSCSVRVEIDPTGEPIRPQAQCSEEKYTDIAVNSAMCLLFLPKVRNGKGVSGEVLSFEIEFGPKEED